MSLDKTNNAIRAAEAHYQKVAPTAPQELALALQFWSKLINNSKAAVAMAQAGFGSQSAAIHRLSIEYFAFMNSLLEGDTTAEKVEQQKRHETYQFAKALDVTQAKDDKLGREALTPENRAGLKKFLENPKNDVPGAGISIFNLLDKADLKFFHDTYRLYSLYAAHANGISVVWEPSEDEFDSLFEGVTELLAIADLKWNLKLGSS